VSGLKEKVYQHCINLVTGNIARLQQQLEELKESMASETKSTAGDKYETGRAMLHIEQDHIRKQLSEAMQQKAGLDTIDIAATCQHIAPGCFVQTNKGHFLIAIGLGKIQVDGQTIFIISPASPLGLKVNGLKKGDHTDLNGKNYIIEAIS